MHPIEDKFLELVQANAVNRELLDRLQKIELPDWYLVAGCLVQTVWNGLTGQLPERGHRREPRDAPFVDADEAAHVSDPSSTEFIPSLTAFVAAAFVSA